MGRYPHPPSPILSDSKSTLKQLLQSHFTRQEETDAKNHAVISTKLHDVNQTLQSMQATLLAMQETLRESVLRREQHLNTQAALLQHLSSRTSSNCG
ncbi:hypothetical protein BYT27DRAFT_6773889 [Phlegmacium glaucopus]|nr:hypothetical protein BYT27DRAFT_6773889 [Phlegmacium glaucopus]